jgi:hypothetical protein
MDEGGLAPARGRLNEYGAVSLHQSLRNPGDSPLSLDRLHVQCHLINVAPPHALTEIGACQRRQRVDVRARRLCAAIDLQMDSEAELRLAEALAEIERLERS